MLFTEPNRLGCQLYCCVLFFLKEQLVQGPVVRGSMVPEKKGKMDVAPEAGEQSKVTQDGTGAVGSTLKRPLACPQPPTNSCIRASYFWSDDFYSLLILSFEICYISVKRFQLNFFK